VEQSAATLERAGYDVSAMAWVKKSMFLSREK
jgi:hypothetical protein